MTAMGERSPRGNPPVPEPAPPGPVIACIEEGAGGLAAARIAGSLARWLGADLLLATVQQAHPFTPAGDDLTPAAVRHGRLTLVRSARELDHGTAIRVAVGEPAEKLLALADSEGAELLVVPAPSQSRVRTLLLGSVYLALAGAAPCPVVVVAPRVETIATTGPIVCGVDGSAPSLSAARAAADLAARLESRLLLVHATTAAPGLTGGYGAGRAKRHDEGHRIVQGVADRLPVTVPKLLVVEHGPAAERLARVAQAESAQMLVTGSRGCDRTAPALLGSVASELATTVDRPLMIVPPDARSPAGRNRPGLATRWLRGGAAVLSVPGELDSGASSQLERAAARLLTRSGGRLVLDLSESRSIGHDVLSAVERLARRAGESGGALVLVATNADIRRRLDRIGPPWIIVTAALDSALETVAERTSTEVGEL